MKINRLQVSGLFGLYDYDIDFSRQGGDFTVLTSPNGYGKTTLLRIIRSLHVKRLFYLYTLKFHELTIWFNDGNKLIVSEKDETASGKNELDARLNQRRGLTLQWYNKDILLCNFDYSPDLIQTVQSSVIRRMNGSRHYPMEVMEYDSDLFIDGEFGESLNTELAQIQKQEQFLLQLATVQTDFIAANRIYSIGRRNRPGRMRSDLPVLQIVYDLKERLQKELNAFQSNFQRLDSKFIDMLLEGKGHEISEEEYVEKAESLLTKMDELTSFGLTNKQTLPVYQKDKDKILDVYISLMDEKLNYYKDLLPLIRLFNKNVQQKKFANKSINLSPQHGIRIVSENGDILSADKLSTGEQNQLVLLYDLIFETPKGSILLIDEPESSLHVAWQNDFVNDMLTISKSKSLQIIVATHSPIVVSNTADEKVFDLFYIQKK